MPQTTIALIGYRGTGKTAVARHLAEHCGYAWIDADVELQRVAGKTIADIFSESGESAFRELESRILADLCRLQRTVLALGGGVVLVDANRLLLADCEAVVWLKASAETLQRRIGDDPTTTSRRPNLTNHGGRNEIVALLAQREPIYRACATLEVDTEDRTPVEIAEQIAVDLGKN